MNVQERFESSVIDDFIEKILLISPVDDPTINAVYSLIEIQYSKRIYRANVDQGK